VRLEKGAVPLFPHTLQKTLVAFGYLPEATDAVSSLESEEVPSMYAMFSPHDDVCLVSSRIEAPHVRVIRTRSDILESVDIGISNLQEAAASAANSVASVSAEAIASARRKLLEGVYSATKVFREEMVQILDKQPPKHIAQITEITTIPFGKWVVSKKSNDAFVILPNAMRGNAVSTGCEPETRTYTRYYKLS
jgi:hypothetical protein